MTTTTPPTAFEPVEANVGRRIPHTEAAAWIAGNPERVGDALRRYFHRDESQARIYQGQHFEWFMSTSDPDRFTAHDLAAVGALDVVLTAQSARTLLEDPDGTFTTLIGQCRAEISGSPGGTDLASCPEWWITDPESPFRRLYGAVDDLWKVGSVKTSKLLAAKFPALIPVRDRRVARLLDLQRSGTWWLPLRKVVGGTSVAETLDAVPLPPGAPVVTTLRRLDVVLWMEARTRGIG